MTDKDITVYTREGDFLSHCTPKRARQMVYRKKAKWRGHNEVTLLFTREDERKIKEYVRQRDGNTCYLCGETLAEDAITYDHIIPRQRGGSDFAENLAVCCKPCNEDKRNRTPEEYLLDLYLRNILTLGGHVLKRHLVD